MTTQRKKKPKRKSRAASYRRIGQKDPMYGLVQANKYSGSWVCDSYDHNDKGGCSNSKCFKYKKKVTHKETTRSEQRLEYWKQLKTILDWYKRAHIHVYLAELIPVEKHLLVKNRLDAEKLLYDHIEKGLVKELK